MSDYMDRLKKLYEWAENMPKSELSYSIERLGYFEEELFKYSQFKIGDEVEIGKDMNITPETSPGYMSYRDRLQVGCCGIIREVDHYKGKFRYAITMDPQRPNGEEESCFTIREETLKPKGWDGRENGE